MKKTAIKTKKINKQESDIKSQLSEERFLSIINLTDQIIWVTNAAGEVKEDIPYFRKFTGQTYDEVKDTGWANALHPDDVENTLAVWTKAVEARSPYETEYRVKRHDGIYRYLLAKGFPVLGKNGEIQEWVGTCVDITERKNAEEINRKNEKRFRELIESLPQLYWTCSVDGPCDYLSKQWIDYTGIPEEKQLGYGWLDQLHPNDKERTVSEWMENVKTGESFDIEFRIRRNDGIYHWFKTRAVPMRDESGKITKWFGSNTDIDEIKNAGERLLDFNRELEARIDERAKELQKSKKLLDETGRLARIGGWEIDLKANTLYWSEATYKIHEVGPDFKPDVQTAINFYAPEAVPVISKCVQDAITEGKPFDVELQLITAKKNRLWVRAIGEAYRENGEVVKVAGVFQDIDQSKKASIELQLSKQKLSLHAKNTPLAVIEFSVDGIITDWNISAEKIFGYSKEEAIGSQWTIIAPERFLGKLEGVWESIVKQEGGTRSTNENQTKDGKVIMCEWFNTPLVNEEGKTIGIASLVLDITEQLRANDELKIHRDHLEELVNERTRELDNAVLNLQRSNQELEQFAYVASHDLQEPLRMVSSYTQLLERRYKDKLDQDAKDFINYAVDGANRMQRLINDLLEFSRVTTKGKPMAKLDLSSVLGQAVSNLHNKIQETGSMIVNEDLPFAYGDESQLVRVFQNLIDNAIKFRGAESPRINITSKTVGDKVQISVSDNGIGIDKIYSERVFTIFQRLHGKTEYPGTGIGLAVCKRTIERHGGKIWFESEPGKGTTFCFTLNTK